MLSARVFNEIGLKRPPKFASFDVSATPVIVSLKAAALICIEF